MNELIQTFNFGINEVRTAIKDNGDVYFCLTDVADVLEISRSSDLLQVQKDFVKNETPKNRGTLDPKGVHKMYTPTNGGMQHLTYINEPNLYRVIFRSNKAEARQFQDWVFNEVLPTIRKTGSYNTKPTELTAKEKVECLNILMSTFGDVLSKEAKETILVTASENLLGLDLGYRPQVQKTYTATQIGEQLGISANKVGKLTNTHNLKTGKYGMRVLDKARGHSKQVETFRYYDNVVPVLKSILESEVNI